MYSIYTCLCVYMCVGLLISVIVCPNCSSGGLFVYSYLYSYLLPLFCPSVYLYMYQSFCMCPLFACDPVCVYTITHVPVGVYVSAMCVCKCTSLSVCVLCLPVALCVYTQLHMYPWVCMYPQMFIIFLYVFRGTDNGGRNRDIVTQIRTHAAHP